VNGSKHSFASITIRSKFSLPNLNPHEIKFVLHRNYTPVIFRVERKWREGFSILT